MSILIGHSSIDENGKARGGAAGDQNGKEVCKRNWYSASWDVVLRCTDPVITEKMAVACEQACDNDYIGYDQNQRNTLNTEAKKVGYDLSKITTPCECDCSSLMCICAIAGGIPESALYKSNNMRTTSNMRVAFKATGKFEALTDSKYLTSDAYLKRGDILVNEGSHTIMVLGEGASAPVEPTPAPVEPSKPTNTNVIGTAVAKGSINVRTGPSTSYKAIGVVKSGAKVEVLEITSNNWYRIVWNNGVGYVSNVSNKYFTYTEIKPQTSTSTTPATSDKYKVSITASALYVRTGPGTGYKAKTTVHKGENYYIVEEAVDSRGVKWGLLENYKTSKDGWISLSYAKKV